MSFQQTEIPNGKVYALLVFNASSIIDRQLLPKSAEGLGLYWVPFQRIFKLNNSIPMTVPVRD